MFNNNITNYDHKLVSAVQQDYLRDASLYRLAKESRSNASLLSSTYNFVKSLIG